MTTQYLASSQVILIHRVSWRHGLYSKMLPGILYSITPNFKKKFFLMEKKLSIIIYGKNVIGYGNTVLEKHK